jgi:hypothetical protein
MPPEYIVHHVLSIGMAMTYLLTKQQPTIFCLYSTIMELGSATISLSIVFPQLSETFDIYKWGMTVSNTLSLSLQLVYVVVNRNEPVRLFYSVFGCLLCAARQHFAMQKSLYTDKSV